MSWRPLRAAVASSFFLTCAAPALADQVIGVADGDSLTVLRESRPLKIRLANVDSPEKRQDFGERAKQSLSELCYRKQAVVRIVDTDRYGRAVALVSCDGTDVNRAQVERGFAWVYTKYNKDPVLPILQAEALAKRRGLWADANPVAPWDFRRTARWK